MARRIHHPALTYLVDSREQDPWTLAAPDPRWFSDGAEYVTALPAGDYSCELETEHGFERLPVVIERKSHIDYCGVIGRDRERFEQELARLAAYESSHIIVEAPVAAVRAGHMRSRVYGDAAWLSAPCWAVRYGVHVWFVTHRKEAQILARAILQEFARHKGRGSDHAR